MTTRALFFAPSSSANINALAEYSWNANAGTAATVTFAFDAPYTGTVALNAAQQANTLLALAEWAKVANVTFTQISGNAQLDFGYGDLSAMGADVAGVAYQTLSGDVLTEVDVVIDDGVTDDLVRGEDGYRIMLHEIGHALGLKHPFEGTPQLSAALDNNSFTLMSYDVNAYANVTPMIGDIAAIQYIYGANTTTTAGDNTYTYHYASGTNNIGSGAQTIWDASGTDAIQATGDSAVTTIDLRAGINHFSTIGVSKIWIHDGVVIENAFGAASQDTINGNSSNNRLFAGLGTDTVSGNEGNDTICGGITFADSVDTADVLYGNAGNDIIYGNGGDDSIFGGSALSDAAETGNDILYGGAGADKLYGNGGNDTLVGAVGNDTLYGGGGDDRFVMNSGGGIDWILPFQGAGAAGGDVLKIDANINGTGITTAAQVIARATSDGTHSWVDLGGGNGVLVLFTLGLLNADDVLVL